VLEQFVPALKQQFPGLQVRQAGGGREQSKDLSALGRLTLVALLIIFALMASPLKSYTQPLIIPPVYLLVQAVPWLGTTCSATTIHLFLSLAWWR
jgi:multidrug efflux pump subunit AcrB